MYDGISTEGIPPNLTELRSTCSIALELIHHEHRGRLHRQLQLFACPDGAQARLSEVNNHFEFNLKLSPELKKWALGSHDQLTISISRTDRVAFDRPLSAISRINGHKTTDESTFNFKRTAEI